MLTASEHIRMAQTIIKYGKEPLLPPIHPTYVTDPMTGRCPRRYELSNHLHLLAHVCEYHEGMVGRMDEGDDDVEIPTPIEGSVLDELRVVTEHLRSAIQIIEAGESDWRDALLLHLEVHDTMLGTTEIYMGGDESLRAQINRIVDDVREKESKTPGGVIPRFSYNTDMNSPDRGYEIINADFDDPLKRFVAEYRRENHAEV